MKKIIAYLVLAIIFLTITACLENNAKSDLSIWIGTYTFEELYIDTLIFYEITIYEENNSYFSNILIEGRCIYPGTKLCARVYGNEEWISLTLIGPTGILSTGSKVDDLLMSFRRENDDIYTYWGKLRSYVPENATSNMIHFEKAD